VLGHKTLSMVQKYTAGAQRKPPRDGRNRLSSKTCEQERNAKVANSTSRVAN
jgi:hypothetical protein